MERAALEAELQNERQARDNAEVRVQFETENLMEHISSLKVCVCAYASAFLCVEYNA